MRGFPHQALQPVAALLLLLSPLACLAQQEVKPAVVVSLASVDKLLGDVGYLTRIAGVPEFGAVAALMAGQYIEGLNTRQPAGAFLTFSDQQPVTVVFVPVSDFAAVKRKIEESVGELQDVGGGVQRLTIQRELFFKEQQGWVFAADRADRLNNLPRDPAAILGGLPKDYSLAVQVHAQQIPPALRQLAIAQIKEGFEQALENQRDEQQRQIQKEFGTRAIEDIVRYMEEADQVTLGLAVDQEKGKTRLDLLLTGVPGSKLAAQFDSYADPTTNFAGFEAADASATFHFSAPVSADDIRQSKLLLNEARKTLLEQIDKDDNLPDAAARAEAKEIVGDLMNLAEATISGGKLNGGATLWLAPDKLNFVAGGIVADGAAGERALKRLVDLARRTRDNPNVQVNFNVGRHGDVEFHTLKIPIPAEEEDTRRILGEHLPVVVGTGPKSVFAGFGNEAMDLLKQVLDNSKAAANSKTIPAKLQVSVTPIIKFAAAMSDDPNVKRLAESLPNMPGQDYVTATATAIPRGATYRLEVDSGVISLIGRAARMQQGGSRPRVEF